MSKDLSALLLVYVIAIIAMLLLASCTSNPYLDPKTSSAVSQERQARALERIANGMDTINASLDRCNTDLLKTLEAEKHYSETLDKAIQNLKPSK